MLVPRPLHVRVVEPSPPEWTEVEPGCSELHRWLGGYEHLKRAAASTTNPAIRRPRSPPSPPSLPEPGFALLQPFSLSTARSGSWWVSLAWHFQPLRSALSARPSTPAFSPEKPSCLPERPWPASSCSSLPWRRHRPWAGRGRFECKTPASPG